MTRAMRACRVPAPGSIGLSKFLSFSCSYSLSDCGSSLEPTSPIAIGATVGTSTKSTLRRAP